MASKLPDFSQPIEGGIHPPVGDLIGSVFSDLGKDLVPYALAGGAHWIVTFTLTLILIPVVYLGLAVGIGGGMVAGLMSGGFVGAVTGSGDLGAIVGGLLSIFCPLVATIGIIGILTIGMTMIVAPMNASLYRAIRDHQLGKSELGFGSPFKTITEGYGAIVAVTILVQMVVIAGIFMLYIPGLIASFVLGLAIPIVALHNRGPMDAIKTAVDHVKADPMWHASFWGLGLAVGLVAAYVPVIGPMVGITYMVKGYRCVFGDLEEPAPLQITG